MLEILACPFPATLQDTGRPGYRHLGVPLSGALDPTWLALANALAGNPPDAAAIEMRLAGPRLKSDADALFAIAGEVDARIAGEAGTHAVAAWRSHRLRAGEELRIDAVRSGVAYLAFAGGIEGRRELGSRARYERADLGSPFGRGLTLKVGAGSPCVPGTPLRGRATAIPRRLGILPARADGPLRVIPGPQRERFSDAAWQSFLESEFVVGHEADRMGLRLDGPRLEHVGGADIVSDAVTPGAIQVPGDGRPIVLLADCQTVGGYTKIATVIGADLPRLGHALPGTRLRFAAVTLDEALAARQEAAQALAASLATVVPDTAEPDLAALYGANLIDGVIDATH
ncbi:MAG: biotin-dependent carboxyltransferase family protein [Sulfuritalea sp.]|jgi:biotin-dependent carboxylase-like uncharacterized protein|nr:biotin-dependent carboxyltransferase family protein [Sulfuritalea sp.]